MFPRYWPQHKVFDNGDVHDLALNSEDGTIDPEFENDGTRYYFSAEMTTICAAWFGDCNRNGMMDHYKVEKLLKKAKVFPKGADAEPESGCLYVYFKTPEIGHKFITRLNEYLEKRYQTEPEVRETHEALVQAYEHQQKERAS
jgi:hypothetical protein